MTHLLITVLALLGACMLAGYFGLHGLWFWAPALGVLILSGGSAAKKH